MILILIFSEYELIAQNQSNFKTNVNDKSAGLSDRSDLLVNVFIIEIFLTCTFEMNHVTTEIDFVFICSCRQINAIILAGLRSKSWCVIGEYNFVRTEEYEIMWGWRAEPAIESKRR